MHGIEEEVELELNKDEYMKKKKKSKKGNEKNHQSGDNGGSENGSSEEYTNQRVELEPHVEKIKKKKDQRKEKKEGIISSSEEISIKVFENSYERVREDKKKGDFEEAGDDDKIMDKIKKKKRNRVQDAGKSLEREISDVVTNEGIVKYKKVISENQTDNDSRENVEDVEKVKKKGKKRKAFMHTKSSLVETLPAEQFNETKKDGEGDVAAGGVHAHPDGRKKQKRKKLVVGVELEEDGKKTRKKEHTGHEASDEVFESGEKTMIGDLYIGKDKVDNGSSSKEGMVNLDGSTNIKKSEKSKSVSFSGQVKVFPSHTETVAGEENMVRGKYFSKEEDEMIKAAVFNYIQEQQLGEDGLNMVLHCVSHARIRKTCWKVIGAAIPWRPVQAVYNRAHILFERSEQRKWEPEEMAFLQSAYATYGPQWRKIADALGKHRFHVKDAWRRIKSPNRKKGHWSQEEYQNLFELVNMDLRMKATKDWDSKHGMLRENISWESISDRMGTRNNMGCCKMWYYTLASPMVVQGVWNDADDYKLVRVLLQLDACCVEDVDWDSLLEHRSGELCLKRWKQMVRHIGEFREKPFVEQVEVLSKRYCPDLLELERMQ